MIWGLEGLKHLDDKIWSFAAKLRTSLGKDMALPRLACTGYLFERSQYILQYFKRLKSQIIPYSSALGSNFGVGFYIRSFGDVIAIRMYIYIYT